MKRLLTICATRIRPHRIGEMLDSFDRTKSFADIVIYVSEDDPKLEAYKDVLEGRNYVVGKRKTLVEVENYFSTVVYPDYQFYQGVNDDQVFHTEKWDEKLTNDIETKGGGWGVACCRDLMHDDDWDKCKYANSPIISGNIVRTLGYIYYPELVHTHTDDYLRDVALGINRLFRNPEVVIEHKHCLNGKADLDDNYKWVLSEECLNIGRRVYAEWLLNHKQKTIDKLLNAIRSDNSLLPRN